MKGWNKTRVQLLEDIEVQGRVIEQGNYQGLSYNRIGTNTDAAGATSYFVTLGDDLKDLPIETLQMQSWQIDRFVEDGTAKVRQW
ncbi:hypothetical protein [Rhizobium sp. F40D2]|uniref:hypothetical protein n=1 Tax=Rhizobium sp. F40D2 TaxID=3453141 RepID=UPI003F1F7BC0